MKALLCYTKGRRNRELYYQLLAPFGLHIGDGRMLRGITKPEKVDAALNLRGVFGKRAITRKRWVAGKEIQRYNNPCGWYRILRASAS